MKRFIIIILLAATTLGCYSCNYLDIVPDERPTEEDAFKDRYAAERYLYGCYAFLPRLRQSILSWATTEVAMIDGRNVVLGNYTAQNVGSFSFWSRYYGAIKRCYILLDNVDGVPRLLEEEKELFKAEARFLIAYYHFLLLRAYGPIPIVTKDFPMDTNASDLPIRSSFDECVQWISDMYDYAWMGLPVKQETNLFGRATRPAAKTLKAKLWLYAASPLFNGNSEFYSNSLLDPVSGEHLMPQQYDESKWEKALEYALEAETECTQAGIRLYEIDKDITEELPFPDNKFEWRARMTYPDKTNNEIIWADTRLEGTYDWQNGAAPRKDASGSGNSWNLVAPTLESVKRFYSSRGLPIEEDPSFIPEEEYFHIGQYDGRNTAKLHLNREPRFYAWIGFHNGWYELQRNNQKRIVLEMKKNDLHGVGTRTRDYSLTGYLTKKAVHPAYSTESGLVQFPFPIIRLAELYLMIAEAAAHTGDLEKCKTYLNKVRSRVGVPDVEVSWNGVATLDQPKLIEIVRRETSIELFLETELFWNAKRWKEAEKYLPGNPHGLNISGETETDFFKEVEVELTWRFDSPVHYLLPIPAKEVEIIQNLVQNPGY